ncbi:MAG: prepilin peptidase [Rhodobiaceae bacterium]|jgi:leader peptidase (prepilin peptidase)/N-methyltransferase|nr:prepilin peptidase [Rhodobiaceae bacterium]
MGLIFITGILGACLGSFANVAALRSLDGRDWVRAPSACFHCHKPLRFWQNVPILGYLAHGGKTACCQHRLPARYLFVELAMAALMLVAWAQLSLPVFLAFVPFMVLMVVIFLTDMDDFIIPDWTSLGGLALGLFLSFLGAPGLPDLQSSLTGGAAGFALIYSINFTYKLWRGHDGMGFGDVKLMAMLGVWLGPVSLLPILFSASLSGAVIGIGAILFHRLQNSSEAPVQLPFGCFLTPMALLWLLFAPQALQSLG